MHRMKNNLTTVVLIGAIFMAPNVLANDGAFFCQGNQLIPIIETDIAVQKEVLRIEKVDNRYVRIDVCYDFFNPGKDKKLLTGFEAMSPSGDVDGTPIKGKHPYMHNFTVSLNGTYLDYQVAIVSDSLYYQNGKFISLPSEETRAPEDVNNVGFNYVYYFEPIYKNGLNRITHSYLFDLSGSTTFEYDIDYILTAANRWANRQIDDFTLIVDMGDFEEFSINASFFSNTDPWILSGSGKMNMGEVIPESIFSNKRMDCIVQQGELIFHAKDFKPTGELNIYAILYGGYDEFFDGKTSELPFSPEDAEMIGKPTDAFAQKVLRNLPFARRGYIFKNPELQAYFSKQRWYVPNPGYEAKPDLLTEGEKAWINRWDQE